MGGHWSMQIIVICLSMSKLQAVHGSTGVDHFAPRRGDDGCHRQCGHAHWSGAFRNRRKAWPQLKAVEKATGHDQGVVLRGEGAGSWPCGERTGQGRRRTAGVRGSRYRQWAEPSVLPPRDTTRIVSPKPLSVPRSTGLGCRERISLAHWVLGSARSALVWRSQ